MTETLCDSGVVKLKAGTNVSTSLTPANYTTLINQAEQDIGAAMRTDVVAGYSGYSANKKKILEDAASSKAAIGAIAFDINSYFSKTEALNLQNFNEYTYNNAMKKLTQMSSEGKYVIT